jgi:predicted ester cyclase
MTHDSTLPFRLPERAPVTRIRLRDMTDLLQGPPAWTQPMAGFDAHYCDIVDYIVRITEEIWRDRAIGRIYETYDASCTVYGASSVVRSVEEVVAATLASLNAYPDGVTDHLNIAWRGDQSAGFYTSHLGLSTGTNLGNSEFGPATGKRVTSYFVADCISRDNRIHTEWLMHDSGAVLHHLGLDRHETAKKMATDTHANVFVVAPPPRLDGQAPRRRYGGPTDTPDGWALHYIDTIWNARRLEHLPVQYAADAVAHWPGCRTAIGPRAIGELLINLLASLPDATTRVEHVCWSEETDGVLLAVRWLTEGTTRGGGILGDIPAGKRIALRGSSHFRFGGAYVVEEWTVFDELDALVQAYRT